MLREVEENKSSKAENSSLFFFKKKRFLIKKQTSFLGNGIRQDLRTKLGFMFWLARQVSGNLPVAVSVLTRGSLVPTKDHLKAVNF